MSGWLAGRMDGWLVGLLVTWLVVGWLVHGGPTTPNPQVCFGLGPLDGEEANDINARLVFDRPLCHCLQTFSLGN